MGFSSHATKTLKSNRALLKKRRSFTELRKEYEGCVGDTQVNFKQLTDFEQKKLKDKIRARAKRDQLKELYAYVLAVFVLLCSFYGFYRFFK